MDPFSYDVALLNPESLIYRLQDYDDPVIQSLIRSPDQLKREIISSYEDSKLIPLLHFIDFHELMSLLLVIFNP